MKGDDGNPKTRRSATDRRDEAAERWDDGELERIYSMTWIMARKYAPTDADVADLVQECVIKVVGGASRCAEWPLPRTWVMSVAKNHCIDHFRSDRTRRRYECSVDDSDLRRIPDEGPLPDQACVASRRRAAVRKALASLPSTQREALRAVFLEGRSCREAAESMGMSKSTVNRAVEDGIARLKMSGLLASWVESASGVP